MLWAVRESKRGPKAPVRASPRSRAVQPPPAMRSLTTVIKLPMDLPCPPESCAEPSGGLLTRQVKKRLRIADFWPVLRVFARPDGHSPTRDRPTGIII